MRLDLTKEEIEKSARHQLKTLRKSDAHPGWRNTRVRNYVASLQFKAELLATALELAVQIHRELLTLETVRTALAQWKGRKQ